MDSLRSAVAPGRRAGPPRGERLEDLRYLQWGIGAILLYGLLFETWLLAHPAGHALSVLVDGWAQFAGPVLALAAGFLLTRRAGRPRTARRASLLLALGVLAFATGALIAHRSSVPSWADAVYLSSYSFLLLGIVLLPRRGDPPLSPARAVVDGLLLMTAVATFSWYFLLGPALQHGGQTLFTRLIAAGFPASDLLLVCCLLLLGARRQGATLRFAATSLGVGLGLIVVADSICAYQALHGAYAAGSAIDPIWAAGYMLIALAATGVRSAAPNSAASAPTARTSGAIEDALRRPSLWQAMVPYALVPAVVALGLYSLRDAASQRLALGVFVGAAILIVLVFLHQILVLLENGRLYDRLDEVYAEALRQSKERYRELFENASDLVFTLDTEGRFTSLNRATEQTIGYPRTVARTLPITRVIAPESLGAARNLFQEQEGEAARTPQEVKITAKDGTIALLEVSAQPMYRDGAWIGSQGIARDITERKRAEAMLAHQALHDALTDLPNRSLLQDRIQQAILAANRHNGRLALLFMDLNRFKEINDTFGHHYGDLVLQEVGHRLPSALRASDTVARLGGDEFALLLPQTDETGAAVAAEKVGAALSTPFTLEGHSLDIGASIGIAVYPEHGEDASTLMRRADVAMYAAKRARSDCVVYSPDQDENSAGRLQFIADLRRAIEHEEFVLHYQPKVSVKTGRIESVEALIRWNHPTLGMVAPKDFIPLAEHSGLIKPLTLWVLNAALRQCRAWHDAGIGIRVAVNLSVANLHDPHLVNAVTDLLVTWQLHPSALQVEITETTIMADQNRAIETLTRLHDMGVTIALDDFGTGYSSFAYLKQLPTDQIKIDRSFISDLASNQDGLPFVQTIKELGHGLGLEIVAEGVEDRKTLEMLANMGCDIAQGFYLSRPVAASELTAWLDARMDRLAG